VIVQARMGSTRLPGKVLADIAGTPMLGRVVDRVRRAVSVDCIIVATTDGRRDDPLADYAAGLGVDDVYRGSEDDVLDRYYQAARRAALDVVVRVTADCPLLDPGLLDRVVALLTAEGSRVDYAANTLQRAFPRGLDVEAVPMATLERVWREAGSAHQRAHVFPYIHDHPSAFVLAGITDPVDRSAMRWTVDTPEDLAFVREVCAALGRRDYTWRDVVAILDARPALLQINATVRQKTAHEP
jgi:spore coat polysaccharide biosynthesis protein SpsF (cytidylyltransferase family)